MEMTFYNWDALYERAMDKPFNSRELNAKDNARAFFVENYDMNADESIEDQIDDIIKLEKDEPIFDIDGNYVAMAVTKGSEWRYEK